MTRIELTRRESLSATYKYPLGENANANTVPSTLCDVWFLLSPFALQWSGAPATTLIFMSAVSLSTKRSSMKFSEPSSGLSAKPVGHCNCVSVERTAPRHGAGDQWLLWPWCPISVWIMPFGSTARIFVPSAMYIVRSAAITMPFGCDKRACRAGPPSPQFVSSPI